MNQYQISVNGQSFDVRILSDPRDEEIQVEVDGRPLTVQVRSVEAADEAGQAPPPAAVPTDTPPAAGAPPPRVEKTSTPVDILAAPLPGTVKSIRVEAGQRVAPGDILLVIEAMKMDNIIRSPREGVVGQIHAAVGSRVAHGEPILRFLK